MVASMRREWSKKSVQQGRLLPGSSRRATPLLRARSVLVRRERSRHEEGSRLVRPHRRYRRCEPEGPEKWRECRWWIFSTFPVWLNPDETWFHSWIQRGILGKIILSEYVWNV